MHCSDVMNRLGQLGNAATKKTYIRHGVTAPLCGVKCSDLYQLQKEIGMHQELAAQLWATGHHDARVLATLIADPQQFTAPLLEEWLRGVDNRFLCQMFTRIAGQCPVAFASALRWTESKVEMTNALGWGVLAVCSMFPAIRDDQLGALLPTIESRIHQAPNYARYTMNQCLIAIGVRVGLRAEALAVAKRVGKVEVDHGDTDCKTPLAFEYIQKIAAREAKTGKKVGASSRCLKPAKKRGAVEQVAGKKVVAKTVVAKKAGKAKAPRR